jgi:hypothetical protein
MKTHRSILPVAMQSRPAPRHALPGPTRPDPLVRTTRGMLILAVVLGSLGVEAAATSGHTGDHVSGGQAANIRLTASAYQDTSSSVTPHTWMY